MSDTLLRSIEEGKALTETQFASLLSLSLGPPSVASNFDASSITSSLTSEQKGAIQAMVDETGEAFEVCLRLWVEASKAETRRRLERRLAIPLGSLDNQVPTTARALLQIGISLLDKLTYVHSH